MYKQLREIEKRAVDSLKGDDSPFSVCAKMDSLNSISELIREGLDKYKYSHGDLTRDEAVKVHERFRVSPPAFLEGGRVVGLIDGVWQYTGVEHDLFAVLDYIQELVNGRTKG